MNNDEQRAALVESIAQRIDTFAEHVGYGDPDVTREEASSYIAEIEEALLADRAATVAEPDAETVERDGRDAFEKVFGPLPPHCIRVGSGYAATEYNAWSCHTYIENWKGWRAAIAAMPSGRDAEKTP